jgi:hypothetical protein
MAGVWRGPCRLDVPVYFRGHRFVLQLARLRINGEQLYDLGTDLARHCVRRLVARRNKNSAPAEAGA